MSYLGSRLSDAVCVELLNIFNEKLFADYGTEDDEALECGLKLWLALTTLKRQWITEQILEKCIEYVDMLINSKSDRIKHHVCTTALRIKPEQLGKVKKFLLSLHKPSHYHCFERTGNEPKFKLEGGKAGLIYETDWNKVVPVNRIEITPEMLKEATQEEFAPDESEIDF